MNIENMFFIPLFHTKCFNWQLKKNKLKNLCGKLNYDGYQYNDFSKHTTNLYINDIDCIFEEEIKNFKNINNIQHHKIVDCWFEKFLTSNYHQIHNHGPLGYSAVCYIDYIKTEHKPLVFISPFNNFLNHSVLFYSPEFVEEGTIIFFPSTLNHYVDPNKSENERLVVSFNLKLDRLG